MMTVSHARRIAALTLGLLLVSAAGPAARAEDAGLAPEPATGLEIKQAVQARSFLVVAANPLAATAGAGMIRQGGTAADAAVAVQMVLGLVEPQSSGVGGGAFMLYQDHGSGDLIAFDGR